MLSDADIERIAEAFIRRYTTDGVWTDEQLDRALADHDMPALALLPDVPCGIMVRIATLCRDTAPSQRWRRLNATHLLAHAMLHDGQRCSSCVEWGKPS
jgi:hypothetical protein